ncbi:MAG TPA: PEP-CTERM sorting domain-containing protein [Bryobacteraceae bacterium]|jgi:hypothetical protein|nr:PEP-CTERM sorting domain-containing protein [Bryobacteraceae bacterium]
MIKIQKILIVPMALAVSGIASADSITLGPITTSTPVSLSSTDWTNTLAFAQFDSSLGTLQSVTFDISGQLQTTLTITNQASGSSTGHATTELQVGLEDAGDNLGLDFSDSNPAIDALSPKYFYDLGAGQSAQSGLLTKTYDSGALTYTLSTILNEFSNPGGGTVDLTADTFTQTYLSNSGGNTSASQVTSASLTGTVTYVYQANQPVGGQQQLSATPEPDTMALLGGALIGLALLGKRFRKTN